MMNDTPVVLLAYNRPEALRRTLAALAADDLAAGTDLFIRIDGPKSETDAEKVKAFRHPQFIGIDLNSRFETAPALKDITLIDQFIKQIKA